MKEPSFGPARAMASGVRVALWTVSTHLMQYQLFPIPRHVQEGRTAESGRAESADQSIVLWRRGVFKFLSKVGSNGGK